ncbi:hypothetical protein OEZ85_007398 [Tetradesmus obliquus]|uniref:Uncharacterized protein n=1 Tax=Tetradesmus obliquus TaxID=3088 RepID=A0ABY8TG40_TETOB|nr:hypothetical protein OEZ85_007398 [Tetradesmus obliquus]
MDLQQQVNNFEATIRQLTHKQVVPGKADKKPDSHEHALQAYSNGQAVPYSYTLRVVQHEGARATRVQSAKTQKPPGYIRNESGGMFTS